MCESTQLVQAIHYYTSVKKIAIGSWISVCLMKENPLLGQEKWSIEKLALWGKSNVWGNLGMRIQQH